MVGLTSPSIDVTKNVFTSKREHYLTVFFFGFLGENIEQQADSEKGILKVSQYNLHWYL